jgi:hypothetical protein
MSAAILQWLRRASAAGLAQPPKVTDPLLPVEDADGGLVLHEFAIGELQEERDRRLRTDARGAGLITTSSALAALAFAAAALVTNQKNFEIPRLSLWGLLFTFAGFMVAAFCGLRATGLTTPEQSVSTSQLLDWRNDDDQIWHNTRSNVTWLITRALILYVTDVRAGTNVRARWIAVGSRAQLAALVGLVVAVGAILLKAIEPGLDGWGDLLQPPGR